MYTRPCFLLLFFSLPFCLLHIIPYWSGVMIILENKDGMYLVAAPRLAWFQGFIACVIFYMFICGPCFAMTIMSCCSVWSFF